MRRKITKQISLHEYNKTAIFPVLTWANDAEYNIFRWYEKNHQTRNWNNELTIDILDNTKEGLTKKELLVEVDESGDAINVTDVFISKEDGEGITFYYKGLTLNIAPLDPSLIQQFFENLIKGRKNPYNFLMPIKIFFPYEEETTKGESGEETDNEGYIWGWRLFSKEFASVKFRGVKVENGGLEDL